MTPLKFISFKQYGIGCNNFSALSTVTTDKIYNEFEQEFGERLFLLNELKIQNNEKVKN